MAEDKIKFSELPVSTILNLADIFAMVQGSISKSATLQQIVNYIGIPTVKGFSPVVPTTVFTLDTAPTNPAGLVWIVNGVTYEYLVDYTIAGVTLTWINTTVSISNGDRAFGIYNFSSGIGSFVSSVFGRTGIIIAALNDYAASLVNNDSGVTGATVKDALDALAALITVSSVFGRVGAVIVALSDYDASQIDNDSTVIGATVKDALDKLNTPKSIMIYADSGSTNYSLRRTRSIAAAGSYRLNFFIPHDFTSLEHAYIVLYPISGAAGTGKNVDISVEYTNGVSDSNTQYTASDTTSTYDLGTADTRQQIEITSLLTNLAADTEGAVFQDNKSIGGATNVMGILIEYK